MIGRLPCHPALQISSLQKVPIRKTAAHRHSLFCILTAFSRIVQRELHCEPWGGQDGAAFYGDKRGVIGLSAREGFCGWSSGSATGGGIEQAKPARYATHLRYDIADGPLAFSLCPETARAPQHIHDRGYLRPLGTGRGPAGSG